MALSLPLLMMVSACSAGQVTQTATQDRDKTGGFGSVGDVTIRAVQLPYPPDGIYQPGDEAELRMAIVNNGPVDDELRSISGDFFTGVAVTGAPSPMAATAPLVASDALTTVQHRGASPVGPRSTITTTTVNIPVPADEAVYFGKGGPSVVLTGLTRPIDAAQSMQVTLTFARAGQTTVTVIVAPAPKPLPRDPVIEF
ncbi:MULTISPECIES: copper chaperone PCu(A)C [unclassified Blastococcus]|uniref:copper chaperone PCu(A)C n=1 Tax=unclassified Blastococcus TaxID=2619396 RepID=UPI001EF01A92|nr:MULTISPECIES: copper chaperone PCu(A)C [unclassified Blastococcus]